MGWVGWLVVTGQLPFSPLFFGCWRSLRSCARRRPVYPPGQGTENLRRKSATQERRRRISGPQAPTKEGLEGPERARTIRRTAAKKRRRHTRARGSGALRRHPLDPTAGREADARRLVAAQRKPVRALRACTSLQAPGCARAGPSVRLAAGIRCSVRTPSGNGGPPPATSDASRPGAADRPSADPGNEGWPGSMFAPRPST
jgi:hypothetical protein